MLGHAVGSAGHPRHAAAYNCLQSLLLLPWLSLLESVVVTGFIAAVAAASAPD
jgi:hypothetical protein